MGAQNAQICTILVVISIGPMSVQNGGYLAGSDVIAGDGV